MIGRTLAHYRITASMSAGGMGEVYRAGLPGFDPLRADPRFAALLERLGLPTA